MCVGKFSSNHALWLAGQRIMVPSQPTEPSYTFCPVYFVHLLHLNRLNQQKLIADKTGMT